MKLLVSVQYLRKSIDCKGGKMILVEQSSLLEVRRDSICSKSQFKNILMS
jgi:hypothetical protein